MGGQDIQNITLKKFVIKVNKITFHLPLSLTSNFLNIPIKNTHTGN